MKCCRCKRSFTKIETRKMITEHANGEFFDHIIRREDPPESPVIRAWHQKCWYISKKAGE